MSKFLTSEQARVKAGNDKLVFSEICSIQQQILTAISDNEFEVCIDGGTPITSTFPIISASVVTAGSGFYPITAEAEIKYLDPSDPAEASFLSAGFEEASLTPIVGNEGGIIAFSIEDQGAEYKVIEAEADESRNGTHVGTDAVVQLDIQDGVIIDAFIESPSSDPGDGYTPGDDIPIEHPFGVDALVEVSDVGSSGEILELVVVNGGSGYDPVHPTIEIVHPVGISFDGIVQTDDITDSGGNTVEDAIVGVRILKNGTGYDPVIPFVNISDPTGQGARVELEVDAGTQADAFYDVDDDGNIVNPTIVTNGSGYTDGTFTVQVKDTQLNETADFEFVVTNGSVNEVELLSQTNDFTSTEIDPVGIVGIPAPSNTGTGEITEANVVESGFGYTDPTADIFFFDSTNDYEVYEVADADGEVDVTADEGTEFGFISPDYLKVYCNQVTDRVIKSQLNRIVEFFQDLGYEMKIQTNPDTGVTIRWKLYW